MTSPTLIVMSGLPGSGKSTLAQGLSLALAVSIF
jgi:predicted kinase